MYQVRRYVDDNDLGTATLLECLIDHPVERLILASSMSVYGEGLYQDAQGRPHTVSGHTLEQLQRGDWEIRGPDGEVLTPIPTPESKQPSLASVYAITKYAQERTCLVVGRAYGIPTLALRFFNIFGTRQALSNPYTGVLAIFASRLLNDQPPLIFEDGYQKRDFVSVHDVARACRLALEATDVADRVFNIGSGRAYTIREVAQKLAAALKKSHLEPQITGKYRVGDIRHCFADISAAKACLGYEPQVEFESGLVELADWLQGQQSDDRVPEASAELAARGLTI